MIQPFQTLHTLKIAVVGAGPAGFYTSERLLKLLNCQIDIYDSLPVPFGLARYGVAPDHQDVKKCITKFNSILDEKNVRFVGNTEVSKQLPVQKLREAYHAVVLSYGCSTEKRLNIKGEVSSGVLSGKHFVEWYNGHPNSKLSPDLSNVESVSVIGNGNVSLDIARMLLKNTEELQSTDISSKALEVLQKSSVKNVNIIGRRGPLQASFSSKELRALCNLPSVNVNLNMDLLESQLLFLRESENRTLQRMLEILAKAGAKPKQKDYKNLNFMFLLSPTSVLREKAVRVLKLICQQNSFGKNDEVISLGKTASINSDLIIMSVGYKIQALDSLPLDHDRLKNFEGRVIEEASENIAKNRKTGECRLYASGWVKTGPTGVLAKTMFESQFTADSIVQDLQSGIIKDVEKPGFESIKNLIGRFVSNEEWKKIDAYELNEGKRLSKVREKILTREKMLEVAFGK